MHKREKINYTVHIVCTRRLKKGFDQQSLWLILSFLYLCKCLASSPFFSFLLSVSWIIDQGYLLQSVSQFNIIRRLKDWYDTMEHNTVKLIYKTWQSRQRSNGKHKNVCVCLLPLVQCVVIFSGLDKRSRMPPLSHCCVRACKHQVYPVYSELLPQWLKKRLTAHIWTELTFTHYLISPSIGFHSVWWMWLPWQCK